MTPEETLALVRIVSVAHDRQLPEGLAEVWYATLHDLPFGIARQALVELLQTSPYLPKPADVRERARLLTAHQQREAAKRRQIEDRHRHAIAAAEVPVIAGRTGAEMVRHVLGRLRDAGQDIPAGKRLGVERAQIIAEAAAEEWLDKTDPSRRQGRAA